MRVRPSLIAAASISAAINRLGLSTDSCQERLLADLVGTDADQLAILVRSIETLMAAQLASVQQQEQQQQQQQHHLHQQHPQHVKSSNKMQQTTNSWELDVQPETPTDIQDIHFWDDTRTLTNDSVCVPVYVTPEYLNICSLFISTSDGWDSIIYLMGAVRLFIIIIFFYFVSFVFNSTLKKKQISLIIIVKKKYSNNSNNKNKKK